VLAEIVCTLLLPGSLTVIPVIALPKAWTLAKESLEPIKLETLAKVSITATELIWVLTPGLMLPEAVLMASASDTLVRLNLKPDNSPNKAL